jgi:iron complex transport system substrate-binding protein
VASFQELNYEAIIRLKPDLVVLPVDRLSSIERLTRLGLPVLTLDTRSLDGFREAVFKLGEALNRRAEAKTILNNLNQSEDYARKASIGQARPKVLFSVMHNYEGLGYINEINAVGEDGFFSQIIKIAGADNAYAGPLAFPRLSRESIIFLNPDVIVDILLETDDLTAVRADWRSLSAVKAIENERLYFLTNQSDTVPGPRSYLTIQRLADFFHPAKESVNDAHPGS